MFLEVNKNKWEKKFWASGIDGVVPEAVEILSVEIARQKSRDRILLPAVPAGPQSCLPKISLKSGSNVQIQIERSKSGSNV